MHEEGSVVSMGETEGSVREESRREEGGRGVFSKEMFCKTE